jgi:hypothetical protein
MADIEVPLFDAEAIRDTNVHNSSVDIENIASQTRTIIIHNGLDQAVDIQCQGDRELAFGNPLDVGSAITVAANTNTYATMVDFFPFVRVTATCSTAPTAGSLSAYMERGF